MTERIQEFLRNRRNEGQDAEPCLVVDLEVVRDNYQSFAKALPDSRVFYAVKANPAPGWPSPHRTRGCPAAPSKRSDNCRARLRGRRRGTARRPGPRHGGCEGIPEYGRS